MITWSSSGVRKTEQGVSVTLHPNYEFEIVDIAEKD